MRQFFQRFCGITISLALMVAGSKHRNRLPPLMQTSPHRSLI
jgi:hypothetical protein